MYAVMQQLNITYNVTEGRSFIKARSIALLLTLLYGVLVIGAFALIVMGGVVQDWLAEFVGRHQALLTFFAVLRWVIIAGALLMGFDLIYYLAPNVQHKCRWLTAGASSASRSRCWRRWASVSTLCTLPTTRRPTAPSAP
jgi:membrane protein